MPHETSESLPYVTAKSSRILGKIKEQPEDFRVDEIPAYTPSGDGDHLFIHIEKIGLTTQDAAHRLARALGVDPRRASWAGMKDRQAVTTQWLSVEGASAAQAEGVQLDGVRVLAAVPHDHKLRTGHLRGNRFQIRVRGAAGDVDLARDLLTRLALSGCPNYFGEQRFGRGGDNASRALAWVLGDGPAPRGKFQRKLMFSSLQAAMFNRWLADRISDDLLGRAIAGDILRKEDTGGLFVCQDVETDDARARAFEVSATGPMFGHRMRQAEGGSAGREAAVLDASGLGPSDLEKHKKYGEGTRRAARVPLKVLTVEPDDSDLVIGFELPKGSYATVVLREVMKPTEIGPESHP